MVHRFVKRSDYLEKLNLFRDKNEFVKVITGVRRCGKSTLLQQYVDMLKESGVPSESIFSYNFESLILDSITDHRALNELFRTEIPKVGKCYVFLDEIQRVDEWERSVNGLMSDTEADIYITGSNAHILSGELATYLTGRYISIEMFPLSFKEYVELNGGAGEEKLFDLYLKYGGFPAIGPDLQESAIVLALRDLQNSILYEDVVSRGKIRKTSELEKTVRYLMQNIGNIVSVKRMAEALSMDRSTVDGYIKLLEQACLFYRADRFDIRSTELSPTPKYYAVDLGLRGIAVRFSDQDLGRILENVVYVELLRRGYKVQVGSWKSKEIDFLAESMDGGRFYVQVCLSFADESVPIREKASLLAIDDNHPKVILLGQTMNYTDEDGIRILNIRDWLMGRSFM